MMFRDYVATGELMPVALPSKNITTLHDFTAEVEKYIGSTLESMAWYRGCGKATYLLQPGLYRHTNITDASKLLEQDSLMISRFKQRCIPYLPHRVNDIWEYLFLMQHFGVPTRLLDWTENPYVALYFALEKAGRSKDSSGGYIYHEDAAVWLMDPPAWNRTVFSYQGYKKGVLSLSDSLIDGYSPAAQPHSMNSDPAAMYGAHNISRIVAQKGVFTMFGKNSSSMESLFANGGFPPACLNKLVIPKGAIASLRAAILAVGITESVVFPDLDGLSREIKRQFGYEE